MKFSTIASDAFQKLQLNAGVLLTNFDPAEGVISRDDIFAATGGGLSFAASPEYSDFGEDIDNVPANTMELKRQDNITVTLSGTAKTVDTATARTLIGAAEVDSATGKITPRRDLRLTDFHDIWWVGDYSDVNDGENAGFVAVQMKNALNTSGFSMQTNDKGKGDFSFEFTAHFSLADVDAVPYAIYISGQPTEDEAQLASLAIGSLGLTPPFSPSTKSYTCRTTASTNTITATAAESGATVEIFNGDDEVTSGSSATWVDGDNVVSVIVTNGDARTAYTVTVTKG